MNNQTIPPHFFRRKATCGFTLIELLVVIIIISIVATFITISIDTRDEDIKQEAKRFTVLSGLALEEAMLKSQEISIALEEGAYGFYKFNNGAWEPLEDEERLFRERLLPQGIRMDIALEGEDVVFKEESAFADSTENPPRIYLLSSGEFTPFEILFKDLYSDKHYKVIGDFFDGIRIADGKE